MTSAERSDPAARELISVAEFRGWLARAECCSWFEYHRGLLILDRSPASALSDDHRRALAKIANAVFQAADRGQVHLVQRRNGECDFSYLAIKASRGAGAVALAPAPTLPAAA